jgi:hypothetical protein
MASKTRVSIDEGVNFSQFIPFKLVQAAANTFIQLAIPTNVSPANGFVLELEEVVVNLDTVTGIATFAARMDYVLSRASKTAIPDMTDLDIIAKGRVVSLGAGAVVAGSIGLLESPVNMQFTGRQIIAAQTVYLGLETANFTGIVGISGRIYYRQLAMPKDRILEILYG